MTSIKVFVMGVLVGTLFGAIFLGAISHLLVLGFAAIGIGTAALALRRRRLPRPPDRKGLKPAP